jgi:hypothetical protein
MNRLLLMLALAAVAPTASAQAAKTPPATPHYQIGDRLAPAAKAAKKESGRYREVKWDELISPDWDPSALIKSLNLDSMLDSDPRAIAAMERLRQEWDNAPANEKLDGADIRLAGFVVPLDYQGTALREFLLVPYFGACIHVPPPPANQIVHVVAAKPVPNTATMDAVWVSGRMKLFTAITSMGRSGYRLDATQIEPFTNRP